MEPKESTREDVKAGLMIIRTRQPIIFPERSDTDPGYLAPSGYLAIEPRVTQPPDFAIIILHGDGEPQVEVKVTTGNRTRTFNGAEFRVVTATEEHIKIEFINTDKTSPRKGPTLEIAWIRSYNPAPGAPGLPPL
jgi:hypothetical protein